VVLRDVVLRDAVLGVAVLGVAVPGLRGLWPNAAAEGRDAQRRPYALKGT
jgi:hypothetical protein